MAEQLEWQGDLNTGALSWSLSKVVERHAILRTTFKTIDGVSTQTVHPPNEAPLTFEERHVESLTPEEIKSQYKEFTHRPFDLTMGPLIRVLVSYETNRTTVQVCIHHIATDGWSTGVLFRELQHLSLIHI